MSIRATAGLVLICLIIGTQATGAQDAVSVTVVEEQQAFPQPAATIELRDANGAVLAPVDTPRVLILEDGRPVAAERVRIEPAALAAPAPTLGVVLDASELLGAQEVEAARAATTAILALAGEDGRAVPVGLWLPSADAATPSRVAEFAAFTEDRNAVINYLNTRLALQPRGTPLYAGAREAVDATAEAARTRGASAVAVLVSDGLDPLSADQYEATLSRAREQGVRVLALRFGPRDASPAGAERLQRLAAETGGTFLDHPAPEEAAGAYGRLVQPSDSARYRVGYLSELPADERAHSWQIVLTHGGRELSGPRMVFDARLAAQPLRPAGEVAQTYLLYAVPGAVLLCGVLALLLALWRRITRPDTGKLHNLARAGTRKRSAGS